jgi:hypothetical protein
VEKEMSGVIKKFGIFRKVLSVGLGLIFGIVAGLLIGMVLGVGIAVILGIF